MVWFDAVRPYLLCGFVALYLAMIWEVVFVYKVGMLHEGVCFVHHTTIFLYTSFGYLILPRYIYIYTNTSTQPSNHPTKQQHKMPTPSKTTDSEHARLQNDYGADYWVRNSAQQHRRATAGRGLFAGLQDVKHYNVDHGWAKRKSEAAQPGILGSLWSRLTGL